MRRRGAATQRSFAHAHYPRAPHSVVAAARHSIPTITHKTNSSRRRDQRLRERARAGAQAHSGPDAGEREQCLDNMKRAGAVAEGEGRGGGGGGLAKAVFRKLWRNEVRPFDKHRNIAHANRRDVRPSYCVLTPRWIRSTQIVFLFRIEVRVSQSFAGAFELPRIESYGFATGIEGFSPPNIAERCGTVDAELEVQRRFHEGPSRNGSKKWLLPFSFRRPARGESFGGGRYGGMIFPSITTFTAILGIVDWYLWRTAT